MIIFFEKDTGKIIGTIEGRIHSEDHLKMWIGDKTKTDRLVIDWKVVGKKKEKVKREVVVGESIEGTPVFDIVEEEIEVNVYEPDHPQREIMVKLDERSIKLSDYKVGKDKKLVKKTTKKDVNKKT